MKRKIKEIIEKEGLAQTVKIGEEFFKRFKGKKIEKPEDLLEILEMANLFSAIKLERKGQERKEKKEKSIEDLLKEIDEIAKDSETMFYLNKELEKLAKEKGMSFKKVQAYLNLGLRLLILFSLLK